MRIYTSSWFTKLPDTIQRVGISRGTPRGMAGGYRMVRQLAPGPWFKTASVPEYRRRFMAQLRDLNAKAVADMIGRLGDGKDVALLCYEAPHKPDDWCHRGFVSAWLHEELGIEVHEWGFEEQGFGHNHPKIPAQFRGAVKVEPVEVGVYIGASATDQNGCQWTVTGRDPQHPDQAIVVSGEERRSISRETLERRFKPVG